MAAPALLVSRGIILNWSCLSMILAASSFLIYAWPCLGGFVWLIFAPLHFLIPSGERPCEPLFFWYLFWVLLPWVAKNLIRQNIFFLSFTDIINPERLDLRHGNPNVFHRNFSSLEVDKHGNFLRKKWTQTKLPCFNNLSRHLASTKRLGWNA